MPAASRTTSTEFQQNVGRYQDAAQRGPVTITKNGRAHTVLVSAELFELLLKGRRAAKTSDLDRDTIKAIKKAKVGKEHAHLDALLKDWTP